jgi:hypothetical protein
MHTVQDEYFDANFWSPAALDASNLGISSPLGTSVVYDSHVQGAWRTVQDLTTRQFGTPEATSENEWVSRYVSTAQLACEQSQSRAAPHGVSHGFVSRADPGLALGFTPANHHSWEGD